MDQDASMMGWKDNKRADLDAGAYDSLLRFHMCAVCMFSLVHCGVSCRYSGLPPTVEKHTEANRCYKIALRCDWCASVSCDGLVPQDKYHRSCTAVTKCFSKKWFQTSISSAGNLLPLYYSIYPTLHYYSTYITILYYSKYIILHCCSNYTTIFYYSTVNTLYYTVALTTLQYYSILNTQDYYSNYTAIL